MDEAPVTYCYRHPDRPTRIECRRCERPICGECMIPAAVGFQCPQCVKSHMRATRQNQGVLGGQVSANPRQTSTILAGVNLAIWVVIVTMNFAAPQLAISRFLGLVPQGSCSPRDSLSSYWPEVGRAACETTAGGVWVPGLADGAWWQILTSIFTHVGITHVLANCLTLWFLGQALESYVGRARFLATYLVSGVVGSLAVYFLSDPNSLTYGASGSVFGLMGALLVILWRRKGDFRQLLLWLGLNLVITFIPGNSISWQGHLGGLIGGALLGCVWAMLPATPDRPRRQWLLTGGLLVLAAAGFVARTMMLS